MTETRINWRDWLYAAYFYLGIRPEEFWQLTPTELIILLNPPKDRMAVVSRKEFEALKEKFPDQKSSAEPL